MRRRSGFIEVLVVIAIIAVLTSLLLLAIQAAREAARRKVTAKLPANHVDNTPDLPARPALIQAKDIAPGEARWMALNSMRADQDGLLTVLDDAMASTGLPGAKKACPNKLGYGVVLNTTEHGYMVFIPREYQNARWKPGPPNGSGEFRRIGVKDYLVSEKVMDDMVRNGQQAELLTSSAE